MRRPTRHAAWQLSRCGAPAVPSRRRDHRDVRRYAAGLSLALLTWNNLVHLVPGTRLAYVPLNLAAAGAVVGTARRRGLSWSELGLGRDRLPSGARWGGAVAAAVAAGLAVAVAVPSLHPLLDDARVRHLGPGTVAYHALVRVPLGTVVLEEVAFRGALFGALARDGSRAWAAVGSSVVFGLWHIRPTLGLLDANDVAPDPVARAGAVAAAVVVTTAGGLLFCLLRVRSGSTLAPVIAHTATNSLGIAASAAVRLG